MTRSKSSTVPNRPKRGRPKYAIGSNAEALDTTDEQDETIETPQDETAQAHPFEPLLGAFTGPEWEAIFDALKQEQKKKKTEASHG